MAVDPKNAVMKEEKVKTGPIAKIKQEEKVFTREQAVRNATPKRLLKKEDVKTETPSDVKRRRISQLPSSSKRHQVAPLDSIMDEMEKESQRIKAEKQAATASELMEDMNTPSPKELTKEALDKHAQNDKMVYDFLQRECLMQRLLGHKMLHGRVEPFPNMGYYKCEDQIHPPHLEMSLPKGPKTPPYSPRPRGPRTPPGSPGPHTPPLDELVPPPPPPPPLPPIDERTALIQTMATITGTETGHIETFLGTELNKVLGTVDKNTLLETLKTALKTAGQKNNQKNSTPTKGESFRRNNCSSSVRMELVSDGSLSPEPQLSESPILVAPPPPPVIAPPPRPPMFTSLHGCQSTQVPVWPGHEEFKNSSDKKMRQLPSIATPTPDSYIPPLPPPPPMPMGSMSSFSAHLPPPPFVHLRQDIPLADMSVPPPPIPGKMPASLPPSVTLLPPTNIRPPVVTFTPMVNSQFSQPPPPIPPSVEIGSVSNKTIASSTVVVPLNNAPTSSLQKSDEKSGLPPPAITSALMKFGDDQLLKEILTESWSDNVGADEWSRASAKNNVSDLTPVKVTISDVTKESTSLQNTNTSSSVETTQSNAITSTLLSALGIVTPKTESPVQPPTTTVSTPTTTLPPPPPPPSGAQQPPLQTPPVQVLQPPVYQHPSTPRGHFLRGHPAFRARGHLVNTGFPGPQFHPHGPPTPPFRGGFGPGRSFRGSPAFRRGGGGGRPLRPS